MSIVLIDSSALAKTLIEELESPAFATWLDAQPTSAVLAVSSLAIVELRRMATRLQIRAALVLDVISGVDVIPVSEPILHHAAVLPQAYLRTLDAIQLATALAIEAETVATYDERMLQAAQEEGMQVACPR